MTGGGRATRPGDYLRLLRLYLSGGLAGRDFCIAWNRLNSNDRTPHDEPLGRLLNDFFVVVERFEPDPAVLADLQAEEPGVYVGEEAFKPLATGFLKKFEAVLGTGRMLDAVVRGRVTDEALRAALAAVAEVPVEEVASAREARADEARVVFDRGSGKDGFGTQVTVSIPASRTQSPRDDHAFAAALARALDRDALVLSDPAKPDGEPFFGMLHRPDGKAYRVPLRDLESGGVDVVPDESRWQRWTPPR